MTKEHFISKWWPVCPTTLYDDLEALIATEIEKAKVQPKPSDKVQISKHTLVEVNRAFRALKQDRNSYIHKVFSDDGVFDAMEEIRKMFDNYFVEQPQELKGNCSTFDMSRLVDQEYKHADQVIDQVTDQVQNAKPFDKERFEAMFRAVVASGRTERWEQDFKFTEEALTKLEAYYAEKDKKGINEQV